MSLRLSVLVPLLIASTVLAADLSEKWSKRLESADANYQQAIQKADNTRFYAVQKATQERVKVLKTALADATKSGDFDAATEIKSRLAAAETAGGVRPKPKNTVKFGGHEYAVVDAVLSFHNAKRHCQEMGGHLVTFETLQEQSAVLEYCRQQKLAAWIGASNEDEHDKWMWVTGTPVVDQGTWRHDNHDAKFHGMGMTYWPDSNTFNDDNLGARMGYVCEWDN